MGSIVGIPDNWIIFQNFLIEKFVSQSIFVTFQGSVSESKKFSGCLSMFSEAKTYFSWLFL